MDKTHILAQLDAFVRERFELEGEPDYEPEANLFDLGFVDSVGAMEILAFAEDAFGITVTQRDITLYPVGSVAEIADMVAAKLG